MPISLDSSVTTESGIALVAVHVRNTEPVDRRVAVENRLQGSVLPPRRHGVPEPGWSADGYAGVVDAHDELALGYACRLADGATSGDEALSREGPDASGTEDPVELVAVSDPSTDEADPLNDALAELADHRPPPDALGPVGGQAGGPPESSGAAVDGPSADGAGSDGPASGGANSGGSTSPRSTSDGSDPDPATLPPGVARYLEAADGRISHAETLENGSVSDVTAVLDAGIGPAGLQELVATDARTLARIAERAESLVARAEVVDVPTDAMERLA
ncbi:hypothetical protein [Halobaculum rubrum]|uniref:DUF7857 domain-containing protein n=1 Tax=Halobaculum rubrum TaxID=2872158 RepID=UPI001CA3D606|nr:hypothetical protein [Halobaculum rubrum]QZY00611.1 hypothetical protein K6T25_05890 [Halobaculum rubrum]